MRANAAAIGNRTNGNSVRKVIRLALAGAAVVSLLALQPWRVGIVSGGSMEPTLPAGTPFVYARQATNVQPLRAGDIVLIAVEGQTWIKRIFALGGERFWVLSIREEAGWHLRPIVASQRRYFEQVAARMRGQGREVVVERFMSPWDTLFVMGDGYSSYDSRECGPIPLAAVRGRVVSALGRTLGSIPAWDLLHSPVEHNSVAANTAEVASLVARSN